MTYRMIRKEYRSKSDVIVLRRILEGVYPYRIERTGRSWTFMAIVLEADYPALLKCL
jgi:hypothetical protein